MGPLYYANRCRRTSISPHRTEATRVTRLLQLLELPQ